MNLPKKIKKKENRLCRRMPKKKIVLKIKALLGNTISNKLATVPYVCKK